MLQVPPRDSIAMPPPSEQRAPESAASAAGVHAGLKRGRDFTQDNFKHPIRKCRDACPRISSNLAGLPGPILAKGDIVTRILIHCRVSFEFLFWPFLAGQNENTE